MLTDCEQCPGDHCGSCCITLAASESVSSGGRLKEDKSKENEDLGPDTGFVSVGVDAECLEEGENDENNGPCD